MPRWNRPVRIDIWTPHSGNGSMVGPAGPPSAKSPFRRSPESARSAPLLVGRGRLQESGAYEVGAGARSPSTDGRTRAASAATAPRGTLQPRPAGADRSCRSPSPTATSPREACPRSPHTPTPPVRKRPSLTSVAKSCPIERGFRPGPAVGTGSGPLVPRDGLPGRLRRLDELPPRLCPRLDPRPGPPAAAGRPDRCGCGPHLHRPHLRRGHPPPGSGPAAGQRPPRGRHRDLAGAASTDQIVER